MNYLKIQQDILKTVYNDRTKDRNKINFIDGVHDDRVWVVFDGVLMCGIPTCLYFLDTEQLLYKMCKAPISKGLYESMKKGFDSAKRAEFTGTIISAGKQLNVYKSDDGEAYVDPKLLGYFDSYEQIAIVNRKSPVYAHNEHFELEAVVMPVNV